MDERLAKTISGLVDFDAVKSFETNARKINRCDDEVVAALKERSNQLGRALVAEKTGLDLSDLSPAEEKIVQAAAEYAAIKKRDGRNTQRTFNQLASRGLLDSAEASVAKPKPTQGFQTLADENLSALSYEQIIVDYPDEFSARALWYARRTLNLPNDSQNPPAKTTTPIQTRTEELLRWLKALSSNNGGYFPPYANGDAAAAIGMGEMLRHGRAYGNIVSRLDFACYKAGLPPLGLTAETPFAKAWGRRDRDWAYPIPAMQAAARAHSWTDKDYARVLQITEGLAGQAYLIWREEPENAVRLWAFGLNSDGQIPLAEDGADEESLGKKNKPWTRDELIIALDLYLRSRNSPFSKGSSEVAEVSAFLNQLAAKDGKPGNNTYRNINGVYMKMMNFRRLDPDFTSEGKVGLTRGNRLEEVVWKEFADDPPLLALAVTAIRAGHEAPQTLDQPYWVFVCNPKKWAVDRFFDRNIEFDSWGVRPADKERFATGQLGIVRVGVDKRNATERGGRPPLDAGIYAICEVVSSSFPGTGANDEFWGVGEGREPGWPTVKIRYMHIDRENPLTIETLKEKGPELSSLLLNGFQGATFPISGADFRHVADLLNYDLDDMPPITAESDTTGEKLASLEKQFLKASPEIKERVSRTIERGPVGHAVKKALGFKCQLCYAMGLHPLGFAKKNGEFYVEAHHVMPVAALQLGSLAASNIMVLCANHHRQIHYGRVQVLIAAGTFNVILDGTEYRIARPAVEIATPAE